MWVFFLSFKATHRIITGPPTNLLVLLYKLTSLSFQFCVFSWSESINYGYAPFLLSAPYLARPPKALHC